ncbi:hypothetical protein PMI02_05593, partial [Novosphingobium sp. AP12]
QGEGGRESQGNSVKSRHYVLQDIVAASLE